MIAILTLPPSVPPLPPSPPGNVPPKADLGDLSGLVQGTQGRATAVMINSGEFDGAKAYKDSKVRRVEQGLVGLVSGWTGQHQQHVWSVSWWTGYHQQHGFAKCLRWWWLQVHFHFQFSCR